MRQKVEPSFVAGAGITVARARSFTPVRSLFLSSPSSLSFHFFPSLLKRLSSLYDSPSPLVPVSSSVSSTSATATVALRFSFRPLPTRFTYVVLVVLVLTLSPPLAFCSRSASSSSFLFLFPLVPHPLLPFLLLRSFSPSSVSPSFYFPLFLFLSPSLSFSAALLPRLHQPRSQMLDSLRQVPLTIMTTLYPQVTTDTNT